MEYGICTLSIVPGRREPADQAEIVTQLLFGDYYKVVDTRAKWLKARTGYDNYECWIDKKQHHPIEKEEYIKLDKEKKPVLVTGLTGTVGENQHVLIGSTLPGYDIGQGAIGGVKYEYTGDSGTADKKRSSIAMNANRYLNAPYLWGGKTPFGIDCSGFTQMVYKLAGVKLPRDSKDQAELGQSLSFIEEAEEGDLAFFDNKEGVITHVGILLGDNKIIHASGKVRIDRIDHQGIYDNDARDYSHKLRIMKKVI